jgi:hypothetical protein
MDTVQNIGNTCAHTYPEAQVKKAKARKAAVVSDVASPIDAIKNNRRIFTNCIVLISKAQITGQEAEAATEAKSFLGQMISIAESELKKLGVSFEQETAKA